jgi:hypothetical protein
MTTIALSEPNAAGLAWAVELSGLSLTEIVNLLLAGEVEQFQPTSRDEYMENMFGAWRYKTRADAERVLEWVKSRRKTVQTAIPRKRTITKTRFQTIQTISYLWPTKNTSRSSGRA